MSDITVSNVISGEDNTDATSYTTGSASPGARARLLFAFAATSAAAAIPTPTVTGFGLTWTLVTNIGFNGPNQLYLFSATTGATAPTPATLTIDFGGGAPTTGCIWSLDQASRGSTLVQSITGSASAASVSANYAAFADATNNVGYAAAAYSVNSAITPRASWTELADLGHGSPNARLETQYLIGQDTAASASGANTSWALVATEVSVRTVHDKQHAIDSTDHTTTVTAATTLGTVIGYVPYGAGFIPVYDSIT